MDDANEGRGVAASEGKVISIVGELARRKVQKARERGEAMHLRELEESFATTDMVATIKAFTAEHYDAERARIAELPADEARIETAGLRSMQALQRCLLGEVEAGLAEWEAIVAEVPDAPRVHLMRARWLMGTDKYAALRDLERAVALDPQNPQAYLSRGSCLAQLGEQDRAVANFRRAIALDPEQVDALVNLGKTLAARGEHAEAVRMWDRAINLSPGYVDLHLARADSLEELERWDAAARDYARVLELDPNRHDARFYRMFALLQAGRLLDAIAQQEELCAVEPEDATNHRILAELRRLDSRHAAAIEAASRAIALEPSFRAYMARGKSLHQLREDERARDDFTRAAELEPGDPAPFVERAKTQARQNRLDLALEDAERVLALAPEHAFGHVLRACYRDYLGGWDRAVIDADYDRAVELAPADAFVIRHRALYHYEHDRHAEAIADAERVIALTPDQGVGYWLRARSLELVQIEGESLMDDDEAWERRYRAAIADLEKSLTLGFHGEEVHHMIWNLYCSLGELDEALAALDRGIAAEPASGELHYRRWQMRQKRDPAGAEADKARALELGFRGREWMTEAERQAIDAEG